MSEDNSIKFKFLLISSVLLISGLVLFFIGLSQVSSSFNKPGEVIQTKVKPEQLQSVTTLGITGDEAKVTRVVDGDTVEIENGEKVRYIGIDTPETVDPRRAVACFGKEASDENKKLVEGKNIILMKDVSEKDKFGRLLRLVYLKKENGEVIFVNDYLVRNGFAKASTYPPDVKFASQFVEAEKEARISVRGLWKICP